MSALLIFSNVQSQDEGSDETESSLSKKFYVKVYGSYGFFTQGSFKAPASQSTTTNQGVSTYQFEAQKKGMGAGLRVGAGLGYILNEKINIGLDFDYLKGTDLTSNSSSNIYSTILIEGASSPDTTRSSGLYTISHKIMSIIPNITFRAISAPSFHIYTRVGVIISVSSKMNVTDTSNSVHNIKLPVVAPDGYNYYTQTSSNSTYEYKSNPGVGYQAALGIQIRLADNLRLFAEVVSNSLVLHPLENEQTSHTSTRLNKSKNRADVTIVDKSRNIQQFEKDGNTSVQYTGTPGNYVVFYQSPRISVAVNSLNVGAGIAFRF